MAAGVVILVRVRIGLSLMPHGTKLLIRDVRCHAASGGNPDMARTAKFCRNCPNTDVANTLIANVEPSGDSGSEDSTSLRVHRSGDEGTRFRPRSCVVQIGTGKGHPMISRRTMVLAFTAGTFLGLSAVPPFELDSNV